MKHLLFLLFFTSNSLYARSVATCNVSELNKRLITYKELTEEATSQMKKKMYAIGCVEGEDGKKLKSCDHDVQREMYIKYMDDYNKTMEGIIAMESQEFGCPKELVDSLMKK